MGILSAFASPILVVTMAAGGILPRVWYLAGIAIGLAFLPILLFASRNRPDCEKCGGGMRIDIGFPRLTYICRRCGDRVHTGLHADY